MNETGHDFGQVCRSCLRTDSNLKCIHDIKVSEEKQIHLADFIRRMTLLKISKSDNLPDTICMGCIEKFVQAYKTAEMFSESDVRLKKWRTEQIIVDVIPSDVIISVKDNKDPEVIELKNVRLPKRELNNSSCIEEETIVLNVKPEPKSMKMLYEEQGQCLKEDEMNELAAKEMSDEEDVDNNFDDDNFNSEVCIEPGTDKPIMVNVIVEEPGKMEKPKRRRYKERIHKCSNCHELFSNRKLMRKHEKTCDPSLPFKCTICPKAFDNEVNLKTHMMKHSERDERSYICDACGEKFKYEHLLRLHSYKHSEVKPFPCTKCSKGCITAESLRRHMKIHDVNYEKKIHTCGVCKRDFPYKSFLAEHMKMHTGEKPFLCSLCGRGFRQSGALEYHIRTHTGERPYQCSVCQKKFTSPGVLKVHMRSHTDERPYVCDICGMAFRQSTDMRTHHRIIHTGDKPILCTLCGKKMSSTGQLTVHLRSHTGEKPFSCSHCSKAFATKTTLVKHERIHTGSRPYRCTTCGKSFNQSSTLNTHMRIHKGKNKENVRGDKIDLNQIVENSCLILEINESVPPRVVQVEQIAVSAAEQVVLLPTPVPLLQNL